MKTDNISITIIEADEGKILTNGETFSKKVFLGKLDTPDNWREIDEANFIIRGGVWLIYRK